MNLSIKTYKFEDGERTKMLFNNDKNEYLFYPNVYVTDQIRKTGGALSTMEQALGDIKFFMAWCEYKGINLEKRILHRVVGSNKLSPIFLTRKEVNQLTGDCKLKIADLRRQYQDISRKSKANGLLYLSLDPYEHISSSTEYTRLTRIAHYLDWLQSELLGMDYQGQVRVEGEHATDLIRNFRPRVATPNPNNPYEKGLSDEALDLVIKIMNPNSDINPFSKRDRLRNQLVVDLLRYFGLRAGELLKLRCHDFDFEDNMISVTRVRNDEKDTRVYEPRTKTLARDLPAVSVFMQRVREYIVEDRSSVKGSEYHPYLLVSNGGPTKGKPISQKSINRIFSTIRGVDPRILSGLSPHDMRHRWNYDLSRTFNERIEKGEVIPSEEQRKIRNQHQGWTKGSLTSLRYNQMHDYEIAQKASLYLQQDIVNRTGLFNIESSEN